MEMQILTDFFKWCTILNGGLLIFSSFMLLCVGDLVYRIHSKWFPMSREAFNVVIYSFVGVFKLIWIAFNVVPYVALLIIG
jgi:hypothetical protein